MRRGELPFWTPYLFSGFPFLADPQVGASYPLNWPFFLLGITPRAIQWELVLHAFLGCAGAYLLLRRLVENEIAALVGACGYGDSREGVLEPRSLLTLVNPDALGVISGKYAGPGDITQYYFYAGMLLVPLAVVGLREARPRLAALLLIVPTAWYILGPAAGLYRLGAWLPGFHKVRAPILWPTPWPASTTSMGTPWR